MFSFHNYPNQPVVKNRNFEVFSDESSSKNSADKAEEALREQ
jgi:hypothetical protein